MKHNNIKRLEVENENLRKIAACKDKKYIREREELRAKLGRIEFLKKRKSKLKKANKKVKSLVPSITKNTELIKERCDNLDTRTKLVTREKERNMRILFGHFLDENILESPIDSQKILMSSKLNELKALKQERKSKIFEIMRITKNLKSENFYLEELVKKGRVGEQPWEEFNQKKEELQELDTLYSLIK